MPYQVNFTDSENKTPITVYDNTSSQDTSLTFPGRNVTGYGQIIGENFLHLLENFASANAPINPVEGQLWYDTTNGVLQLYDNTNWKAASNIQKGPTEPSVETSKIGELWVDTTNQQLRIFTGARWLLVGPSESSIDGLRYGPAVETITDSDNVVRNVVVFYIADVIVGIVSKDSFRPKLTITGFETIQSGINIATPQSGQESAFLSIFQGGELPKLIGTATTAESLKIGTTQVASSKFLRTDSVNTTEKNINIRNNSGLTVGVDGNFSISTSATAAKIYNSTDGSSVDLQTNRNGVASTILRVIDNKVGINVSSPESTLDLDGDFSLTGAINIADDTDSINAESGSIITAGGVSIAKTLRVGQSLRVAGSSTFNNITPLSNDAVDLGALGSRWKTVYAKKLIADEFEGTINGNITGNANTSTNLKSVTTFRLRGDVESNTIKFDGQIEGLQKEFVTELTANIIKGKDRATPDVGESTDSILIYRASDEIGESSGLLRMDRDQFVADLGVPIGTVFPYAGSNIPDGYLLCDGSEQERVKYPDLYDVIGTLYNGSSALVGTPGTTFRLPSMQGRFPLGRHNMNNNTLVPNSSGAFVNAGGGVPSPARVEGTEATTLAASSGQSSVELTLGNLPEHTHNLSNNSTQYSAIRIDSAIVPPGSPGLGPTNPGQAQYINEAGPVKVPSDAFQLGQPVGIMNPFLTMNYIIRSGPPKFTTEIL